MGALYKTEKDISIFSEHYMRFSNLGEIIHDDRSIRDQN